MKLRAAIILEQDRGQDAIQHLGLEDEVPEEGKVYGKVRVRGRSHVEVEAWRRRPIMNYNATVLRVILEKMLSECLITCPRTVDCVAVEVRGQVMRHEDGIFFRITRITVAL